MPSANPYILIIDDDPEDRQALSDELNHHYPGITIKQIDGGLQLLRFLVNCPARELPAVMVLDFQMPDLSGPEVLLQMASDERYRDIVKVMWSTSRRTKDKEECRRLGAAHYLIKPDTVEGLKEIIHQLSIILEVTKRA